MLGISDASHTLGTLAPITWARGIGHCHRIGRVALAAGGAGM
jgi:hypothetical protein